MAENTAVVRVDNCEGKARIKELKRAARNDSMGGSLWQIGVNVVTDRYSIRRSKQFVRGGRSMKKKNLGLLAILFFVVLTTAALAQTTAPSDEGSRPGPGMMYGQSQGQGSKSRTKPRRLRSGDDEWPRPRAGSRHLRARHDVRLWRRLDGWIRRDMGGDPACHPGCWPRGMDCQAKGAGEQNVSRRGGVALCSRQAMATRRRQYRKNQFNQP